MLRKRIDFVVLLSTFDFGTAEKSHAAWTMELAVYITITMRATHIQWTHAPLTPGRIMLHSSYFVRFLWRHLTKDHAHSKCDTWMKVKRKSSEIQFSLHLLDARVQLGLNIIILNYGQCYNCNEFREPKKCQSIKQQQQQQRVRGNGNVCKPAKRWFDRREMARAEFPIVCVHQKGNP